MNKIELLTGEEERDVAYGPVEPVPDAAPRVIGRWAQEADDWLNTRKKVHVRYFSHTCVCQTQPPNDERLYDNNVVCMYVTCSKKVQHCTRMLTLMRLITVTSMPSGMWALRYLSSVLSICR